MPRSRRYREHSAPIKLLTVLYQTHKAGTADPFLRENAEMLARADVVNWVQKMDIVTKATEVVNSNIPYSALKPAYRSALLKLHKILRNTQVTEDAKNKIIEYVALKMNVDPGTLASLYEEYERSLKGKSGIPLKEPAKQTPPAQQGAGG
jgi:hypothetical protein